MGLTTDPHTQDGATLDVLVEDHFFTAPNGNQYPLKLELSGAGSRASVCNGVYKLVQDSFDPEKKLTMMCKTPRHEAVFIEDGRPLYSNNSGACMYFSEYWKVNDAPDTGETGMKKLQAAS